MNLPAKVARALAICAGFETLRRDAAFMKQTLPCPFNFFSLDAPVDIPHMRHFEISRFVAHASHGQEWETLIKEHKTGSIIGVSYSLKVVLEQAVMIFRCLGGL